MAQFEETNIMTEEEFENLFSNEEIKEEETTTPPKEEKESSETTEGKEPIDVEHLFDNPNPESVGSEENKSEGKEDTQSSKGNSSPQIYSSLAKTLAEEGILFDSEDNKIEDVTDAESLIEAMRKSVQSQLTEEQKRVSDALNNGMEPSVISNYERTIKQLEEITDEQVSAESEQAELLRKQIIYRDYINKGFSKERAEREVNRAITNGTDVEDAKESLESIKETVKQQYNQALQEAENAEKATQQELKSQADSLRKSVLEDKSLFGELELDKLTRQKVLDNIIKPIYKDKETGEMLTAIQKYESENKVDFLKKVGIIYTLTDGFKNLDGLVKSKVRKEVNKNLKELENTINNTQRNSDGSLNFATGIADPESYLSKITLDI